MFTSVYFWIVIYLLIINIITFITFCVDKRKAEKEKWRVPERTLMLLSLLGGSIGGLLAMHVAHHKVNKPKFKYGIPAILLLQCILVLVFLYNLLIPIRT